MTRLTRPSIGGMFTIMVLNLTDTWFVSRLGTDELATITHPDAEGTFFRGLINILGHSS